MLRVHPRARASPARAHHLLASLSESSRHLAAPTAAPPLGPPSAIWAGPLSPRCCGRRVFRAVRAVGGCGRNRHVALDGPLAAHRGLGTTARGRLTAAMSRRGVGRATHDVGSSPGLRSEISESSPHRRPCIFTAEAAGDVSSRRRRRRRKAALAGAACASWRRSADQHDDDGHEGGAILSAGGKGFPAAWRQRILGLTGCSGALSSICLPKVHPGLVLLLEHAHRLWLRPLNGRCTRRPRPRVAARERQADGRRAPRWAAAVGIA